MRKNRKRWQHGKEGSVLGKILLAVGTALCAALIWFSVRLGWLPSDPGVVWSGWGAALVFGSVWGGIFYYLTAVRPRRGEEKRIIAALYREIMVNLWLIQDEAEDGHLLFVSTRMYDRHGAQAVMFMDEKVGNALMSIYRMFEIMQHAAQSGKLRSEIVPVAARSEQLHLRFIEFRNGCPYLSDAQRNQIQSTWTAAFRLAA